MSAPVERPEPHPEPHEDLSKRQLPTIGVRGSLFRIHPSRHSPLYYGRSGKNRFDAPEGEYEVMYVALDPHGSFI
jgi:hypothetical protein